MLYLQNHFLSFFPFSINPKTILSLSLSLGLPTSLHLHRSLFHSIRDPSQSPLQSILRTEKWYRTTLNFRALRANTSGGLDCARAKIY
ncbi:hypothetical protein IHE45_16G080600 [Dioscorea alata]|uniref:Uncharacterized protein n=1 Tax=Dioscorea alata TaxID=55571 RepID=A0ACB7UII9_DIOAL|nr:hypothetical protein IHE45_16G080600 [Dioscorea alata]